MEIDTLTGEYRLRRVDVLHDCGRSINPAVDLGQIEGGFVQGMGWLTTEEVAWDGDGRLLTHSPSTYKIPVASDVPDDFRVGFFAGGAERQDVVHGAKATGEPPLMLAISAFHAIRDAVASAGALHRIDVTIRDMIDEGIIPGPRMAASGRDICATSGMLDWNPSFWKLGMDGLAIFADGVEEVRKAVRINIKEGCDVIKLYVTGEGLLRPGVPPEETMYSYEEIAVAVDEAHKRNRQLAAHVRGNDGVKLCVQAGVDVIEHATYADDDKDFVGTIDPKTGLFTPAGEGPNPKRSGNRNNVGDVWVVATIGPDSPLKPGKTLRGRAHLVVSVPLYMRWEPAVSQ